MIRKRELKNEYFSILLKKKKKKVKLNCFCYESFNCNKTLIVYSVFWNMEYVIPCMKSFNKVTIYIIYTAKQVWQMHAKFSVSHANKICKSVNGQLLSRTDFPSRKFRNWIFVESRCYPPFERNYQSVHSTFHLELWNSISRTILFYSSLKSLNRFNCPHNVAICK